MRGNSSVVERHLAKVDVAGPTPVSRSKERGDPGFRVAFFVLAFGDRRGAGQENARAARIRAAKGRPGAANPGSERKRP
jgi:hypothetical protein